tara:strand:- start:112 stop:408 length:297 start_codon:yes stop_codon:yes gene_type:complete
MAKKSPGLLYEQYIHDDLDDKEKEMVETSYKLGMEQLNLALTNLRDKKDISVDMALFKIVNVGAIFLFKRGMGDALLASIAALYEEVGKEQRGTTGSA